MYSSIRFLLVCLLLALGIFIIMKIKSVKNKRRYIIASVIVTIVLIPVLSLLPIENYFMAFESPERVYKYMNFESKDIVLTVEGENSAFVVGNNGSASSYLIVPKGIDGWKIGTGANTKVVRHELFDGISVNVYQYKNTEEYYIAVLDMGGGTCEISDSRNSVFHPLENNSTNLPQKHITYFAYVNDFNSEYQLTINGKVLTFNE